MVCGESGDCETSGYEDPILIDLGGSGYQLTDVHGGVQFDMLADRKLQQVAWTSTGSNVGLLALDRNGNGDAVFSKLLVWVDLNHNGVSDPGELFGLSQLGISSISLGYELSSWVDVYGNRFSSKTSITRNGATQWIYDVYLRLAK